MKQKKTENNENSFEEVFSFTEKELEEIRQEALRKAKEAIHRWRQQGRWLVCKSCEFPHSLWVGNKIMIGEEKDGTPILEDREKVFRKGGLSSILKKKGVDDPTKKSGLKKNV